MNNNFLFYVVICRGKNFATHNWASEYLKTLKQLKAKLNGWQMSLSGPVEMWWHTVTNGREVKGKLENGVGSQYPSHYLGSWCIQHYYS